MTDTTTALIQSSPKRKPGPRRAADVPRIPRLTALVKQACEVLIDGHATNISEAAKLVGCSREHLSIMLRKPHVEAYFARERERKIKGAVTTTRAAATYVGLLGAQSEKVLMDVSSRILEEAGHLSRQTGRGANISVSVHAGHILMTDEDRARLLGMSPAELAGPGLLIDLAPRKDTAEAV